jgi:hypothetical protein
MHHHYHTVTHFGLEKSFVSIWQAMRYCRQLWRKNTRSVIWTDRPIFDSASFKRAKQKVW